MGTKLSAVGLRVHLTVSSYNPKTRKPDNKRENEDYLNLHPELDGSSVERRSRGLHHWFFLANSAYPLLLLLFPIGFLIPFGRCVIGSKLGQIFELQPKLRHFIQ